MCAPPGSRLRPKSVVSMWCFFLNLLNSV
jgi:hypothetical protein